MNRHRKKYPVKTTVNLLYRKESQIAFGWLVLGTVIFAVALIAFTKFAVIDRLAEASRALQEASNVEQRLAEAQQSNSDYEDVLREYQHYYFTITDSESGEPIDYVDVLDVFGILEDELLGKAGIEALNMTGNVLTINLTEIDLKGASAIAKSLERNELVESVTVSAANRLENYELDQYGLNPYRPEQLRGTTVFMNIILKPQNSEEAQAIEVPQDVEGEEAQ